jgi:hypothetical protein
VTHSSRQIAIASLCAFAVAAIVLVTAVLPAEFGIDPVGTGKALGLLALYDADAGPSKSSKPPGPASTATAVRPREYRVDARTLPLGPGQAFEFKYRLDKGSGMVYAWSANAPLKYEFHGEPSDRALQVQSYEKSEGDYASGTLTAPFAGIHGWYWENTGNAPATITITSAGFFTTAEEFRSVFDPVKHKDRVVQTTHETRPAPRPSVPGS